MLIEKVLIGFVVGTLIGMTGVGGGALLTPVLIIFFGISAVAAHIVPSTGTVLDLAAANVNTALGAVCFLVCALATLRELRASAAPMA